LIILITMILYW